MTIIKMPANEQYLDWDPEALDEYQQWVELERVVRVVQEEQLSRGFGQKDTKLEIAISSIKARLV